MGGKKKLRKSERQARILGELRASPAIRISALAGEFGVSTETIRRDLDELNQQGMLSRTYGGAAPRPFGAEPTLSERYKEYVEERERVGALAARAIKPGQVLMIDAGSTTAAFRPPALGRAARSDRHHQQLRDRQRAVDQPHHPGGGLPRPL